MEVELGHACDTCGATFPSALAKAGHTGKHSRVLKEIEHGTYRGYMMELRRKIPRCAACKTAWTEYQKNRRERLLSAIEEVSDAILHKL